MDLTVLAKFDEAGIDRTFQTSVPTIGIRVDHQGYLQPVGDDVLVVDGDNIARVRFKKISELYTGTKTPPSFRDGPTGEYVLFFAVIEATVIDVCRARGRAEYDAELERLYTHLRCRPDGHDANPLFSYMQAAAQLYMSSFDVSQAEFEAVCRRLSRSAGHFSLGPTSTNYCRVVGASFDEIEAPEEPAPSARQLTR